MSDRPIKVSIQNLYKIFGDDPASVLELAQNGTSKADLLAEHDHVLHGRELAREIRVEQEVPADRLGRGPGAGDSVRGVGRPHELDEAQANAADGRGEAQEPRTAKAGPSTRERDADGEGSARHGHHQQAHGGIHRTERCDRQRGTDHDGHRQGALRTSAPEGHQHRGHDAGDDPQLHDHDGTAQATQGDGAFAGHQHERLHEQRGELDGEIRKEMQRLQQRVDVHAIAPDADARDRTQGEGHGDETAEPGEGFDAPGARDQQQSCAEGAVAEGVLAGQEREAHQ